MDQVVSQRVLPPFRIKRIDGDENQVFSIGGHNVAVRHHFQPGGCPGCLDPGFADDFTIFVGHGFQFARLVAHLVPAQAVVVTDIVVIVIRTLRDFALAPYAERFAVQEQLG